MQSRGGTRTVFPPAAGCLCRPDKNGTSCASAKCGCRKHAGLCAPSCHCRAGLACRNDGSRPPTGPRAPKRVRDKKYCEYGAQCRYQGEQQHMAEFQHTAPPQRARKRAMPSRPFAGSGQVLGHAGMFAPLPGAASASAPPHIDIDLTLSNDEADLASVDDDANDLDDAVESIVPVVVAAVVPIRSTTCGKDVPAANFALHRARCLRAWARP